MGERNWDSYHRWSKTGDGRTEFGKIWFSCSSSRQPWSSTFSSTRKSVAPCSEPKYPWLIPCHVPISIKIWPEIPDEKQPWDSFICANTGRIVGLSWSVRKRPLFPQKVLHYSFIWMFDAAVLHHDTSMQHEPCMVQESVFRATVPPCICIVDQMADRNSQLFMSKDHTNAASQGFCLLLSVGRYPLVSQAEDLTPNRPLWPRHECEECWCEGARGPVPGENAGTYWEAKELKRLVLQGTDAFSHAASLPLALV